MTGAQTGTPKRADGNQQIVIRAADLQDAESIAAIHASSWKSAYEGILPQQYLDREIDDERRASWSRKLAIPGNHYDFVLLAMQEGRAVGFIAVYDVTDGTYDAFIDNLHVLPDEKGKGIGLKLMGAAATRLRNFGKKSVYLWVYDKNLPAFGFYKKLGGTVSDKSICKAHGKELSQTRFYWADFSSVEEII